MFSRYKHLEKPVVFVIIAEFFIQLIDYSYMSILMVFMTKVGYADYQAADFYGYRFLSVLLFSFYLGFYINGRKLKPLFYISAILTPLISVGIIYAVEYKIDLLVYSGMFMMGIAVLGLEVSVLPYILRNVDEEYHSEAISLSYSTISLSGIISGITIYTLSAINHEFFDAQTILKIISVFCLAGVFFIYANKKQEFYVPILRRSRYDFRDIKWKLIVNATIPTLLMATGAGLIIPFMGIFFYKVHNLDEDKFALLSAITTFIVFSLTLYVPNIRQKLGYKTTILGSQSLAIACLLGLSLTEFFSMYHYTILIAIMCFILRQPLMNIAMPITSDITMKYVGFRHRELMSAITAAVWSGSWFFSTNIFKVLRKHEVPYAYIFFITAMMYILSIAWYFYLIAAYEKKTAEEAELKKIKK